jgi:hypothetical protein
MCSYKIKPHDRAKVPHVGRKAASRRAADAGLLPPKTPEKRRFFTDLASPAVSSYNPTPQKGSTPQVARSEVPLDRELNRLGRSHVKR